VRDQGTLAVLIGSGISMIAAGIAVSIRSRRYRARFPHDR
jgi:NhaA family Na+:H+ antiporter